MASETNRQRRRFFAVTATVLSAGQLAMTRLVEAQSGETTVPSKQARKPGGNSSFDTMKHIDAGVLNIGYAEVGPSAGPPVILLHGWPYDIHSFVYVAPLLAAKGYRVLVPYLRGYGTTRFRSSETPRNGQQSALAADCVAFLDALRIDQAILAGFDWGARTVNIVAALWPARCSDGLSKRLPDREPGGKQDASAT